MFIYIVVWGPKIQGVQFTKQFVTINDNWLTPLKSICYIHISIFRLYVFSIKILHGFLKLVYFIFIWKLYKLGRESQVLQDRDDLFGRVKKKFRNWIHHPHREQEDFFSCASISRFAKFTHKLTHSLLGESWHNFGR